MSGAGGEPSGADVFAQRVVGALVADGGRLVLPDEALRAFAREIEASGEKASLATALVALARRLQALPGSGPATEGVTALAALALGDAELLGALRD